MSVGRSNRRTFIAGLGGAAAWPMVVRAQGAGQVRRVGLLMNVGSDDPEGREGAATFTKELQQLYQAYGGNVQIEIRWAAGNPENFRRYAAELVALQSDVIVGISTPAIVPLQQATKTIPIVFVAVVDPVGSGLVSSLARPGGNVTGFTLFEYSIGAKWLELLKEIAPQVTRVAIMRDSTIAAGVGQFAAIQTVAATALELSVIDLHDASNVEQSVIAFAQDSRGGLITTPSPFGANHPDVIASLTTKYKLPAVYPFRYFVNANGLMSYGPVILDQFRRAAKYVNRILRGERTAELPVQAPTNYETRRQPESCKGSQSRHSAFTPRPRRRGHRMRRRAFIAGLGSAVAWPLVARGQQPAMPVIGILSPTSPATNADYLRAFRQALKESWRVLGLGHDGSVARLARR